MGCGKWRAEAWGKDDEVAGKEVGCVWRWEGGCRANSGGDVVGVLAGACVKKIWCGEDGVGCVWRQKGGNMELEVVEKGSGMCVKGIRKVQRAGEGEKGR